MEFNYIPELIEGDIYDCPFFVHCPNRNCLGNEKIEERCLIMERGVYRDLSLKEGNLENESTEELEKFWF